MAVSPVFLHDTFTGSTSNAEYGVSGRYSQSGIWIDSSLLLVSTLRTTYHTRLWKSGDWIVAQCKEIQGAISQGKTIDEALRNVAEAISGILDVEMKGRKIEFSVIADIDVSDEK